MKGSTVVEWPTAGQTSTLVTGYSGAGIVGADIPAEGTYGPSPLFPLLDPGSQASEFGYEVLTKPAAGTLQMAEPGTLTFNCPGDATYVFTAKVSKDGQPIAGDNYGLGNSVVPLVIAVGTGGDVAAPISSLTGGLVGASNPVVTSPEIINGSAQMLGAYTAKQASIADNLALIQLAVMLGR